MGKGNMKNDVGLRGWKGRLVSVGDSTAATGSVVVMGCGGKRGAARRLWGLRMIGGAVKEK